ncbi:DUF2523 domain-containing protein [Pseudomonas sp. DY-1]|uniref:DUF2523 family protein n=1 Tax=Pseudomonas sp. DY-1 TaxID=1755504 RepID=UPI000EA9649C|nr:DUF2523 family protein [Pseudomonas sp. DY-1]AYF90736.1 DUF2523 domain-containing protein [Pseudomonas sp. DY-1]
MQFLFIAQLIMMIIGPAVRLVLRMLGVGFVTYVGYNIALNGAESYIMSRVGSSGYTYRSLAVGYCRQGNCSTTSSVSVRGPPGAGTRSLEHHRPEPLPRTPHGDYTGGVAIGGRTDPPAWSARVPASTPGTAPDPPTSTASSMARPMACSACSRTRQRRVL